VTKENNFILKIKNENVLTLLIIVDEVSLSIMFIVVSIVSQYCPII
jgi:hypothetical protein